MTKWREHSIKHHEAQGGEDGRVEEVRWRGLKPSAISTVPITINNDLKPPTKPKKRYGVIDPFNDCDYDGAWDEPQ